MKHPHPSHTHPTPNTPNTPDTPQTPRNAAISCSGGCGCTAGTGSGSGDDGSAAHAALPGWPRVLAALALAAAAEGAHWIEQDRLGMLLAVVAIALSGLGVYRVGLRDVMRLRLGINALMSVAVTGAFLIGQWPEAAMVMALYVMAERLEARAMDRAHRAIRSVLDLAPDMADVLQADGSVQRVPVEDVGIGAWVRVAPGASVPLDGHVAQGCSAVNQAPITGESQVVDKNVGDALYAGSINQHGELLMHVSAVARNTLLARIVQVVEQAQAARAPIQRFMDRFAQIYTPAVFALACILAVVAPLFGGWSVAQALYQALALLVIACPCALVISTPVTIVSALTAAARHGILIKSGSALEAARHMRVLALDKTGTLTTGHPTLVHWHDCQPEAGANAVPLAPIARALAARSDHPVSRAITLGLAAQATQAPQQTAQTVQVHDLQAVPGLGVQAHVDGRLWWLGNQRFLRDKAPLDDAPASASALPSALPSALVQQLHAQELQGRSITLLGCNQTVMAWFAVADTLRPQAQHAITQLHELGVHTVVLSGDNAMTVRAVADTLGIADARGTLLPQEKLEALAALQHQYGAAAMVGDGINDAPALAQADLGFAMGARHSSAMATQTAEIVLMGDDLCRIADTVRLSRHTHRVLLQNIVGALGIKTIFLIWAALGLASMWMAVLADVGVTLLVVANGLRVRRWSGTIATSTPP